MPGTTQGIRFPISIILTSATEVPSPKDPGETIRPFIWSTSSNEVELGQGWKFFEYAVPSSNLVLPEDWNQYPDTQSTWNDVITDVDQISIAMGEVVPGSVGGIPSAWETPVAEFVVQLGGNDAIAVPTLSTKAVAILLLVLMIAGGASVWRFQAGRSASAL